MRLTVLATELEENPGLSITNGVEELARVLDTQVARGRCYALVLHHPELGELGHLSYSRVTFDGAEFTDPAQQISERDLLASLGCDRLPAPQLTADEQQRLTEMRHEEDAEIEATNARERASMQIVSLADLPTPDLEPGRPYTAADWLTIAAAANKILNEVFDVLDLGAVVNAVSSAPLNVSDRDWLLSLFRDPIVVSLGARQFTNGRHRTAALIAASVRTCVIHVEPGYALPAEPGRA